MSDDRLGPRLELMARDSGLPPELVAWFGQWVRTAPDEDLYRVPVITWAKRNELDEDRAVDLFLNATKSGIFEMEWGVICPFCAMLITTPGGLRALGPNPHCQMCKIEIPAAMDDQVEVTFSIEPGVRNLRYYDPTQIDPRRDVMRMFFSASVEPAGFQKQIQEAALAARVLRPGERGEITIDVAEGWTYSVTTPEVHAVGFFEGDPESPALVEVDVMDGKMLPPQGGIRPGRSTFRFRNRSDYRLTAFALGLHQKDAVDAAPPTYRIAPFLSGKRVLTSQTFRTLFRTETIGDSGLRIKNLSMVFSDLEASTALYERVGDIRALDLVRAHFNKIEEVVARHRGAIVKTIGDAVMAAFGEPDRALAAAAGMARAVRRIDADGEPLGIKIGIHSGSCVAIQTNHQIDYFGSAVNVASRVQGIAHRGEIVVTDAIWNAPGVQGLADDFGLEATPDLVDLRGIAAGVAVHRLH